LRARHAILFFLLLNLTTLQAQEFSFRHLGIADGLLSEQRITMAEDNIGRLWIASDEGVNVFDGYEITSYTKENSSGLLQNLVHQIFCDSAGTVWISTTSGIQYKQQDASAFKTLTDTSKTTGTALFFGETTDHDILILTRNASYTVNKKYEFKKLEQLTAVLSKYNYPLSLCNFSGDQWLAGYESKVVLFDARQQKIIKEFDYNNAWTICKKDDSTFLAGSFVRDTVSLINIHTGKMAVINHWKGVNTNKPIDGYVGEIKQIDKDRFVLASRYFGLYIINVKDSSFQNIVHDPGNASSLKSNSLRKIFITKDKTLFVSVPGISYTSLVAPQFKSMTALTDNNGEKYKGVINCFMEDDEKNIWIGTNSHLAKWNRQTNTCRYFSYHIKDNSPQNLRTIRAIAFDKKNRLWTGVFSAGIAMLKPDGSYKKIFPGSVRTNNTLPGSEILAITKAKDGRFIISCNGGFCFFTPETEQFETFYNHSKLKPVAGSVTYYAMQSNEGDLWLGHRTGLYCYNVKMDSLIKIDLPKETINKLIFSIAEDSTGNMYAAGYNGVYKIPTGQYTVETVIDKAKGLESDFAVGLICDETNKVWIVGNRGLARYDPITNLLEKFTAEDGLLQSNHKFFSYYLSPSHEMFIGSEDGFNYFYPSQIKYKPYPLKVFITGLQLADTLLTTSSFNDLRLSAYNNNLSINYLSVDFRLAGLVMYRYKLTGFDTTYVNAGTQRQARYTNLPAGKYSFVAEASVNGKEWYATTTLLNFTIQQVFWKTWWFISLCILFIAIAVYMLYRFRIKQVKKEAQLHSDYEIKLNELENSALRTQMNPHFIFNSLNTINAFINSNDRIQANQYISKFSKLVRLTLDHSRQKRITLYDELTIVTLYIELEQIRFEKCFDFNISIGDIDTNVTEVPPMIIQPFVENAILHGLLPKKQNGLLKIEIHKNHDHLNCFIEDNGIGRSAAMKMKERSGFNRKSHGMEITVKRIELFNKENNMNLPLKIIDLKNEKDEPCGTRVEIELAVVESF